MIPVRGAEEDTSAELGTINPGSIFLKHLRTGKIKVVPGDCSETPVHMVVMQLANGPVLLERLAYSQL